MSTSFKVLLASLALLGGMGGWIWQRQRASELRRAIAGLRQEIAAVSVENVRLKPLTAQSSEAEAAQRVREDIEKKRTELAGLEARWLQVTTPPLKPRPDEPFTANRDPEKGPVRVEHFRNQGQTTPGAAFQTLIWALATETGDALVPLLRISPAGRSKLEAMVARMTPELQSRYRPPEKVVGMLLALDLLEEDGFAITGPGEPDSLGQVALRVGRARVGRKTLSEKRLPFQRGPTGWQLPITDKMIDDIPANLEQASMYVPPRRGGK
jgi:hypothetical protein